MRIPGVGRWRELGVAHRGVAKITGSAAAGQLVVLAVTPILTRLYSPADFGIFAVLISLVMIVATIGTLRLQFAIPVCTDAEAAALVRVSLVASFCAGLLLTPWVLSSGLAEQAERTAGSGGAVLAVLLVGYLVWVTSAYTVLTNYALRRKTYGAVARRNFLQALGTAGGQLALARWASSSVGLTMGQAIGRSVGVLSLVREAREVRAHSQRAAGWIPTLKTYWRYPVVFLPAGLMNTFSLQFPLLLVGYQYGAADAGNLSQAMRLASVPAALLGGAVSSVVLAEISQRVREGVLDNRARYVRLTRALFPIASAWAAGLLVVAPWALPRLLGEGWASAGWYAAAMAPSVGLSVIVSPLTMVLPVYGRSALQFGLDALRLTLVCGSGLIAGMLGASPVQAVLAMSMSLALVYVVTWIAGLRVVTGGEQSGDDIDAAGGLE